MNILKIIALSSIITFFISKSTSQIIPKVDVQGNLEASGKISQLEKPTESNDLITKSHLDSVLIKFALLLEGGVQLLLDTGYSPKELIEFGIPTDSLITKNFGGGRIGYLTEDGTGLVIKTIYLSISNISWGCQGTNIITSPAYGSGLQNSIAIASACRDANIAAKKALDYVYNGFDDWYLPSKDEFQTIIDNFGIGAIADIYTWTSTQSDTFESYAFHFTTNEMLTLRKQDFAGVTIVRSILP